MSHLRFPALRHVNPPPVFVGGTGRSGTTILGALLGKLDTYASIPIELRFHTDRNGLVDLLCGRSTLDAFVQLLKGPLFRRTTAGGPRGLHLIISAEKLERAIERFESDFEANRYLAARNLIQDVVKPVLEESGKRSWVEMTPWNADRADVIERFFPEMKLVNAVRDGRDVAASVARMWWGPDRPLDALYWWYHRMRSAEAAVRMLQGHQWHMVRLEELVETDRDRTLGGLLAFLGTDSPDVRGFFGEVLTSERAHLGAWRTRMGNADAAAVDGLYREMYEQMLAERFQCIPVDPDWQNCA